MTFYWTNQQGGRLMFYHDHAYGITRLNVYAGEAAGYLLYDPAEESALANAGAPGSITAGDTAHLIPLVIQDKTFVPTPAQISMTDPTWAAFGTTPGTVNTGDLWFPHVYMPNQNPNDPLGGASGLGQVGLRCMVLPAADQSYGWRQRCGDHTLHVCPISRSTAGTACLEQQHGRLPDHSESVWHARGLHGYADRQRQGIPCAPRCARGVPLQDPERGQRPLLELVVVHR